MNEQAFTGINIQYPISELILNGSKIIETRTYPLPKRYLNIDMLLIETPGSKGQFKARVKAIIQFTECFRYKDKKEFHADYTRHKVKKGSQWDWIKKPKYGWKVKIVKKLDSPFEINQGGIIYRKNILLPFNYQD
jgi:hypothetical protein